jgi:hypothetical protein
MYATDQIYCGVNMVLTHLGTEEVFSALCRNLNIDPTNPFSVVGKALQCNACSAVFSLTHITVMLEKLPVRHGADFSGLTIKGVDCRQVQLFRVFPLVAHRVIWFRSSWKISFQNYGDCVR